MAADPVELIHLLYEHGLLQLKAAQAAVAAGDVTGRTRAIFKMLAILSELEGSLDRNAGGSIGHNLARLYQYMRKRLVEGNTKRDAQAFSEVESLLRTLDEGWTAMQHSASSPAAPLYSPAVTETMAHNWNA